MSRKIILLLLGWLFAIQVQPIFAKITISEFQIEPTNEQWVELFNDASESADLVDWSIDDSGGSEKFVILEKIDGLAYKVFRSGKFNLNTSEDSLRLFDNQNNLLESFYYNQSPGENISWGKTVDNTWGICQPTPEEINNCHIPSPTPTATFTSTPTPLPTVTLRPSPTVTFSPTPKLNLTSTKTPPLEKSEISVSIIQTTVSPSKTPGVELQLLENLLSTGDSEILGETSSSSNSVNEQKENILQTPSGQNNQPKLKTMFWLMVLTGGLLVAGSIILFYTARNERNN